MDFQALRWRFGLVATNTHVRIDDCNDTTWRLYYTMAMLWTAFLDTALWLESAVPCTSVNKSIP